MARPQASRSGAQPEWRRYRISWGGLPAQPDGFSNGGYWNNLFADTAARASTPAGPRAAPALRADTAAALGTWLDGRADTADRPLFVSNRNGRLSRDAVECIVRKYAVLASERCPTLKGRQITPHCLRHTAAMELLHNGVGCTVIALWLGHETVETTQIYLHADLQVRENAMERTRPVDTPPGPYRPFDALLDCLETL